MLLLLAGILFLYLGAESLVRGSAAVAVRAGMTPLVIGLTIVAFGTSAPELVVSLSAALGSHTDVALGNVVGSNIFNIAVILGISALILPPRIPAALLARDVPVMIGVSVACLALLLWGNVPRWAGALLTLGLAAYLITAIRRARHGSADPDIEEALPHGPSSPLLDWAMIFLGVAALVLGARWFVEGASGVARALGLSEAVIGLTIVAAGTSLPELATSMLAAFRRHSDIAVGNVVGSNIFNILGILGLTALVHPLQNGGVTWVDGVVMVAVAVILWPIMALRRSLSRLTGGFLVLSYSAYMLWLL